jgi:DNA-binding response OmpR family regulator
MSHNPRTILVVDDDKGVQTTFKLLFEQKGYRAILADDGNQALNQLASERVDLVLLDILMPDKEGIETLIEAKRRYPEIRVVMMSGGGSRTKHDFLHVARKFGADAAVRKSDGIGEILALIDRHSRQVAA